MPKQFPPKVARDNRANQLNPIHPAYHRSRGLSVPDARAAASRAATAGHCEAPDQRVANGSGSLTGRTGR